MALVLTIPDEILETIKLPKKKAEKELKRLKETGFWIAEDSEATLLNEVGE